MSVPATISHDEFMAVKLRENPEFAIQYLREALEDDENPQVFIIALKRVLEARGGLDSVAASAGLKREILARTLSPRGTSGLTTLKAAMKATGLKLSVESA